MTLSREERLASLRILVEVARADGVLLPVEERAIERELASIGAPGVTLATLFSKPFDLKDELARLGSESARRALFESAYALARSDGQCTAAEERLLADIESELEDVRSHRPLLERLLVEAEDTVRISHIPPVVDAVRRAKHVREDALKYALGAAALGAFPIPGLAIATDLAIAVLQTKLVRDVAQYFGHQLDKTQAAELVAGAGLGMGIHIALDNFAKLIPGWGSATGAATAFASTYALGVVTLRYFEAGGVDANMLKDGFEAAEREGRATFAEKGAPPPPAEAAEIAALAASLKRGELTKEAYAEAVARLATKASAPK
ncbi:MAG TPA: hypothetical protein VL400_16810 [Polyangiaceae bacterium]|nr:hypothetical protein [Polyangiaceae bacterium]